MKLGEFQLGITWKVTNGREQAPTVICGNFSYSETRVGSNKKGKVKKRDPQHLFVPSKINRGVSIDGFAGNRRLKIDTSELFQY